MEKIKNIEFLRFLFAVMIVYAHIMWFLCQVDKLYTDFPIYMKMWNNCGDSFLCVEYFFIISGFFLHFHIKNKKDDTFEFAAKKIMRLWPLLAFSIFIIWIFSLFKFCEYYSYANILNLFLLYRTGIDNSAVNNMHSWFVCILFWCSIFYHYILRNFDRQKSKFIIAIICFYSFASIYSWHNGTISVVHMKIINGIPGALLRGFASIGLGFFVGIFYDKIAYYIKNLHIKNKVKNALFFVFVSVIEFYLFFFIIFNSTIHRIKFKNNFIFIIAFCLLLLLFVFKRGLLSKLFENKLSQTLGAFSYSIYIMQASGFVLAKHFLWTDKSFVMTHPYLNIVITLIICLTIGILSHCLIETKSNFWYNKISAHFHGNINLNEPNNR